MQTVYIGNTLINDVYLGAQRVDDVIQSLPPYRVEYLLIAGGGGGGVATSPRNSAGGGGAGGLLSGSLLLSSSLYYTIYVGNGGPLTTNGENSYITGSYINLLTYGGGLGANTGGGGGNGGSGGGGSFSGAIGFGGTGVIGQGFAGGNGTSDDTPGCGGGAGGAGGPLTPGNGVSSSISGTPTLYAKGGSFGAANGTNGLGEGGGGRRQSSGNGGIGGSGVFYIRYAGPQRAIGGTVTTDGNYTIHQFTYTGTTSSLYTG